ncbi:MAG: aldo/keto reductase [Cellulomonas sp.]|uniref:aldo/keto reductase n=1 Tax=Cellulomonas sp. TaxID=40001 RepID=UPI00258C188C|nr:aldo/keto reductase [Cellulomonas sp.]MCR6647502.1 aldo/keto reductase [Cellulomonas sp.]MCR6703492.1 aldo/keto reductase [Cellulomonas sp.]
MTTSVTLADGMRMPVLGFGVYKVSDDDATPAVAEALAAGYRLVDTATLYGNEAGVGRAVRASGLERDEVFVTTKLWNDAHGDAAEAAFAASVERLGLGVPDLYLIHWPAPARDLYVPTWRTLLRLRDEGRVRSVGVSNFQPAHLRRIVEDSGEVPVVNQVELHPYLQQRELRALHGELGVVTQAWSPLGRGAVLADPVIGDIARTHGATPAQVVLRWHLDLGVAVIPKSVTPARIRENLAAADLELTEEDHERISALDRGERSGSDPDVVS